MAALKPDDLVLIEEGRPTVVPTLTVTWEFFNVLGVNADLGRTFAPGDGVSGSESVVVITDAAWRSRFAASPEVVGRRLATNHGFVTVVGVLPRDFEFAAQAEMFVPLHDDVLATYDRTSYNYWLVGLLRAGATIEQANEDLEAVMRQIRDEDPRLSGWSVTVEALDEAATEAVRPVLIALAVAVGVLVLMAAANIAGLFLIHATSLRPQVAIEAALGAGHWRIARRLATEAVVVATLGGAAGALATVTGLRWLPAVVPPFVPIPGSAAQVVSFRAGFDVRVAAFALAATLLAAVAGAVPAVLAGMAGNVAGPLRSSDRSRTASAAVRRAQDTLVAAQIAFATFLLVGGLLAVGTVRNLLAVDTGLRPGGVLVLYAGDLDDAESAGRALYFRRLLDRIQEVPGVITAGVNDYVPLQAEDDFEGISFLDRPPPPPGQGVREEWRRVSEGYFDAAGIEVVAGRGLRRSDFGEAPTVALVNESFVRRHFPDRPAGPDGADGPDGKVLGARILIHERDYGEAVIVGVVRDVLRRGLREAAPPVLYVPYDRHPRPNMAVFVRTAGAPEFFLEAVREAIWSVDPNQPIDRVATMEGVVSTAIGVPRLAMRVLLGLAATAVVLAGLGIFGVLAYAVRSRGAEFGVRMALGATAATLQRMVVVRGLMLWLAGAAAGLGLALLAARAADALLFGIGATDGAIVLSVAVVLLGVAALASWLPTRRIGRIDPGGALRRN
jgi:predicted permease